MALTDFQLGDARTGTYGESGAFDAANYLADLRKQLDAGQINVSDFVKYAKPAATTAYNEYSKVAGGGQKAAQAVAPVLGMLQQAGISTKGSEVGSPNITFNLPDKYQSDLRNSLIPDNATPDERAYILSQIPSNIDLQSDQGKVELEAARQRSQLNTQIGSLGDLLSKQADQTFSVEQPGILDSLQSRGLLNSSAVGESLAREKANLESQREATLGQAAIAGQQGIQQLQTSGLQRTFSLSDFQKQADLAQQIAAMSQPQKSNGSSLLPLAGAAVGTGVGALYGGPVGAAAGGQLGMQAGSAAAGRGSGGTYLCTHLKERGLMTEEEVARVHDKVFGESFAHPMDLIIYGVVAPLFIAKADASGFDWASIKPRLCDDVIACEDNESAFQKYRKVCVELFTSVMPETASFLGA